MSTEESIENLFDDSDNNSKTIATVSLDNINSINIVINDGDCSNLFIHNICKELMELGLKFQFSSNGNNINVGDDAVVISLDQQYISGPKLAILAPYSNERHDLSDALALAADAAFQNIGVQSSGIYCGRKGFRKTVQNSISTRIPSSTEDALNSDNLSFVDICFGTNTPAPNKVAEGIVSTLGRFYAYSKQCSSADLIYRVSVGDTLDSVASNLGTTVNKMSSVNVLPDVLSADITIINPIVTNFDCFDKNVNFSIGSDTKEAAFKH